MGERDASRREREQRRERRRARSAEEDAPAPVRIAIPAIGVSAPIIPLGLNADRTLEVPSDYGDTGWFTGGAEPGERGPAVIAGHVDSTSGPAVFYRLQELGPGDEIQIEREDGSTVTFVAQDTEQHPKDSFPTDAVYGETSKPALRLVTCSGSFDAGVGHYTDNTIVFATQS